VTTVCENKSFLLYVPFIFIRKLMRNFEDLANIPKYLVIKCTKDFFHLTIELIAKR